MSDQPLFETYKNTDVRMLIEQYPLAWVCAADECEASQLPLVGVFDSDDRLTELVGHFARKNPLGAVFSQNANARIFFNGPAAYISPALAGQRNWAPTWNYAHVRVQAEIRLDPEFTAEAVDILIAKMERAAQKPWSAQELGERYDKLLSLIVGFRAVVTNVKAKFKLGQDEGHATLSAILKNLQNEDLKEWMRRLNSERVN